MNRRTHLFKYLSLSVLLAFGLLLACDRWISWQSQDLLYSTLTDVPRKPVAIVLGTSPKYYGRTNHFYDQRITAAAALFHAGKVSELLVSGDNSSKYYNEPIQMQRDLMAKGVPGEKITLDYAGFRTLDSILRADKIFDIKEAIVVSQAFHLERAIWISEHHKLNYIGYIAQDPPGWHVFWKVRQREVVARFFALWDFIIGKEPKFLGPKEALKHRDDAKALQDSGN